MHIKKKIYKPFKSWNFMRLCDNDFYKFPGNIHDNFSTAQQNGI